MIYLDNAATTLIKPSAVHAAVRRAKETMASPGRGAYKAAMRASELALDWRPSSFMSRSRSRSFLP